MIKERKVYGYAVIRRIVDGSEVSRIPIHYPEDSLTYERFERGLVEQMDTDRYFFGFEPIEEEA